MVDKFEREIEEILAKLDDELPADAGVKQSGPNPPPISLAQKRQQKAKAERLRTARPNPLQNLNLNPTNLLFAGAGIMFGGLIVSGFWGPAIWASLAGIVLFISAFFWSFRRSTRPAGTPSRQGHYWRDRWIDDSPSAGASGVKSRFRRK